jgi:4-amino-4-deoxy-L-arabinose transferase-like glycosyltransferase
MAPRLSAVPLLALPPRPVALVLFAIAFIVPGLWHDPWKYWDAIGVGIAHNITLSGDLLVSRVSGVRWMYDPPLYHWTAALCAWLLQLVVETHVGVRVASGLFLGAAFYFIYRAGRAFARPGDAAVGGAAAMLVLLGSTGLIVHAHEALPELATLAALCAALAVLPYKSRHPLHAGAALGAALGLGFLSTGWIAPAAFALAIAIAHLVCAEWRNRQGALFVGVALGVAVLISGAWLLAMALRAPEAFADWWQLAALRRGPFFAGLRHDVAIMSWFSWPAWPLALWALWSLRRRWQEPALFLPAAAVICLLSLHAIWGHAQQENLIPWLAPLALLASHGVFTLRRGAAGAFDWFGVLTFAFFTGLVWLGYLALLTGFPPRIEFNLMRMAPGFTPQFAVVPFVLALVLAVAWLYLVFFTQGSPVRSVMRWAAGIVLLWGTFALLGLPWADHQKSYRSVALQLRSKIPVGNDCIAQRSLGMPQAAAFDYHAGIRTRPYDLLKPGACRLVLVQGTPKHELDAPAATAAGRWTKLADVGRPGDRHERYRLYRLGK